MHIINIGVILMATDNNEQIQKLLKTVSERLGSNPEQLSKAAQNGKIEDAIKNLNKKDSDKIQKILSDKEATAKLLSTPKAQQLLKRFLGDK